jgi:hypothetical protein
MLHTGIELFLCMIDKMDLFMTLRIIVMSKFWLISAYSYRGNWVFICGKYVTGFLREF